MSTSLLTECAGCQKGPHLEVLPAYNDAEHHAEVMGWSGTPDGLWWCPRCGGADLQENPE